MDERTFTGDGTCIWSDAAVGRKSLRVLSVRFSPQRSHCRLLLEQAQVRVPVTDLNGRCVFCDFARRIRVQ